MVSTSTRIFVKHLPQMRATKIIRLKTETQFLHPQSMIATSVLKKNNIISIAVNVCVGVWVSVCLFYFGSHVLFLCKKGGSQLKKPGFLKAHFQPYPRERRLDFCGALLEWRLKSVSSILFAVMLSRMMDLGGCPGGQVGTHQVQVRKCIC